MSEFADISGTVSGEQFLFTCPYCNHARAWRSDQVMAREDSSIADYCPKCNGGYRVWKPGAQPAVGDHAPMLHTRPVQQNSSSRGSSPLIGRYTDAYLIARTTNGFGQAIKVIGLILGVLIAVVGAGKLGDGPAGAFAGFLLGAVVALPAYVLGVIVSAQGQILKATLDTAVNSSPLLSHDEIRHIQTL